MKHILGFLIGFSWCAIVIWLFGFNFDQRGVDLGFSFIFCCLFGFLGFAISNIEEL